jgi:endonuclease/exonuclease/phosphatase family metal-dependent hydrolase
MEEKMNRPERARLVEISLFAVLFLVFFQLLAAFIEKTYVFGLLQTDIPVEIVAVLFLLSPVFLLFIKKPASKDVLLYLGLAFLVCRAVSVLLDTRWQMLLSGLGSGLFLIFLPLSLHRMGRKPDDHPAGALAIGLGIAVLFSMLLRALFSGNDLSEFGSFRAFSWLLAAVGYALLIAWTQSSEPRSRSASPSAPAGFWRITGLSVGLLASLALLYFSFTSPTVIARWTGESYALIAALAAVGLVLFIVLRVSGLLSHWLSRPVVVLLWNTLFLFSLLFTIGSQQIFFPMESGAYPLVAPAVSGMAGITLIFMLLLYPIVFLNVERLLAEMIALRSGVRQLGGAFLLAAFYMLVMIFAQIFTTVYDYIPVIGPLFRDKYWLVFLIVGVGAVMPVLLVRKDRWIEPSLAIRTPKPYVIIPSLVLGIGIILALLVVSARPAPAIAKNSLRLLTYNIQQGYSDDGLKNFHGQLDLIHSMDADLIGLQESDTARIAGGNADVVRFMADRLNMYSYYGPTNVTGTFGIALLSRYPLEDPRTFFMYSEGEQTASIEAEVVVGDRRFHVLVTHLGNGGPLIQQQQVLQRLDGRQNIIAMGDFNFRPESEQYAETTAVLEDAWLTAAQQRMTPAGQNIDRRIDHIFISPGFRVNHAEYLGAGPSDHPAMFAEIAW